MTSVVLNFLQKVKQRIGTPTTILEVGSLNVNGSARSVFQTANTSYIGIDQCEGRDVDIVLDGKNMFSDPRIVEGMFDLVICVETLEHDPYFWITIENMKKALKKGGWLIITTPAIMVQKHNYPSDFYRFFGDTYKTVFFKDMVNVFVEEYYDPNNKWKDLKPDEIHGYGQKL